MTFSGEQERGCQATKESREETSETTKADELEHHTWIDQVLVNDANGDCVPINIEDIAQVVEVDDEGTHQSFLKESSLDPLLGNYTVFENHRKSLIQHCEQSELCLQFEWTKVYQKCPNGQFCRGFKKT